MSPKKRQWIRNKYLLHMEYGRIRLDIEVHSTGIEGLLQYAVLVPTAYCNFGTIPILAQLNTTRYVLEETTSPHTTTAEIKRGRDAPN
jgi:hypothetical protein